MITENKTIDVVIIGCGLSALALADQLIEHKNVIIFTKLSRSNSNSVLAQGGIAAAIDLSDSWEDHLKDTLTAGDGHNRVEPTRVLVEKGQQLVGQLIKQGMNFDRDHTGNLLLAKEGAHSRRRILHSGGDATGKGLIKYYLDRLKGKVEIVENEFAIDLLVNNERCTGVKVKTVSGNIKKYFASHTILATGGCGSIYSFTTNDATVTGDGIAMAYRAGANIVDMEFMQFHPTLLHVNGKGVGLVSEAVRGEGGFLVTANGKRLMKGIHPLEDLAPRDVVAREIHFAILNGEDVYLDISRIDNFEQRFPTITTLCNKYGIDLNEGLVPVVPGAHFLMGGIETDEIGRTSLSGLYAIGETACNGVHGANRLASNSLLECIVFSKECARYLSQEKDNPNNDEQKSNVADEVNKPLPRKSEIQDFMMKMVGINRSSQTLQKAINWIETYIDPTAAQMAETMETDEMEKINMLIVGWLIATSAIQRTESRGGHYRYDYPNHDHDIWGKQVIRQTTRKQPSMIR